jgi:hypothetical protein
MAHGPRRKALGRKRNTSNRRNAIARGVFRIELFAGLAVDRLAHEIGVSDVACGFLDHVDHDPTQRHLLFTGSRRCHRRIQSRRRDPGIGRCDLCPVPIQDLSRRLVRLDPPLPLRVIVIPQRGQVLSGEHLPEPGALDIRQVLDETEEGQPGWTMRHSQLLVAQTVNLAEQRVALPVEEREQRLVLGSGKGRLDPLTVLHHVCTMA